jgi:hypothetical protein
MIESFGTDIEHEDTVEVSAAVEGQDMHLKTPPRYGAGSLSLYLSVMQ